MYTLVKASNSFSELYLPYVHVICPLDHNCFP